MLQFSFSNFAYKRRKRLSQESEKENCVEDTQEGKEKRTPVKAHQKVVPETPTSLLPSPLSPTLSVPARAECDSPRRAVGAKVRKRRQFARIHSSSVEAEAQGEQSGEENSSAVNFSKRRKLYDSFEGKESSLVNTGTSRKLTTDKEHSNEDVVELRTADVSDSTDDDPAPCVKHTQRGPGSGAARGTKVKHSVSYSSPKSSGWLSSSRSKLQTFAFQKKNRNAPSAIQSPLSEAEDELVTQRSRGNRRKKVICISDSDSGDCASPLPGNTHSPPHSPHLHPPPFHSPPPSPRQGNMDNDPALIEADCEEYSDLDSDEEDYSDGQKAAILDFINTSSLDELCGVPGCSLTKARMVDKLRPFETWDHLVSIEYFTYQIFNISLSTG